MAATPARPGSGPRQPSSTVASPAPTPIASAIAARPLGLIDQSIPAQFEALAQWLIEQDREPFSAEIPGRVLAGELDVGVAIGQLCCRLARHYGQPASG